MGNSSRTIIETMDVIPGVSVTASRAAQLVALLTLALICMSCGDTFRPVAIPVTPNPPDPASFHFALVISQNPAATTNNPGAVTRIDVSGDTNVAVAKMGIGPVHGTLSPDATRVYVANSLDDTVSAFSTSDSTNITTISLPAGSHPNFVATTQSDTVYVANLGDATLTPAVPPYVAAITTGTNFVSHTIAVGTNPIALAETPDGKKLYVVNQGSGTVTPVNTIDKSANLPIATGTSPIWAVARSDSHRVYVLDQPSGNIFAIDTFTDAVVGTATAGAGANYLYYDQPRNRIYIANTSTHQIAVFDASVDPAPTPPPTPLPAIDLSATCGTGCTIAGITVLPDGSRAYVLTYNEVACGNAGEVAPCLATKITVIKASDNSIGKTFSVDPGATGQVPTAAVCTSARFRRFIAASADSSHLYVSNCDAGSTASIRTSDDTKVLDLKAPFGTPTSGNGNAPPPQNPVFIIAGR
jgi:YVTN family beta-propeller protein